MKKKLNIIFSYLKKLFPSPETELRYSTPFQFVVAVMLSAQATDIQVNKVTDKLFKKIKKPDDLLKMGFALFERSINSVNYYHSKAKHIFTTASLLMNNEQGKMNNEKGIMNNPLITQRTSEKGITLGLHKGQVKNDGKMYKDGIPDTIEELMKLPGVGIKTAKLIAHVLYDKPFIAVDTHIHRVSNRLGLIKTTAPEKTSEFLEKRIPDEYKDLAHHALVLFGRYYCTARNPKCMTCKLQKICVYYHNTSSPFQGEKKRGVLL